MVYLLTKGITKMRYPSEYKCDETRIIKFEKFKRYIEYEFWSFSNIIRSTPVSYEGSTILKQQHPFISIDITLVNRDQ